MLASRPRCPGFNSWSDRTYYYIAALGKLLTLNCLGGITMQCMKGVTIDSFLLCVCVYLWVHCCTCPPFKLAVFIRADSSLSYKKSLFVFSMITLICLKTFLYWFKLWHIPELIIQDKTIFWDINYSLLEIFCTQQLCGKFSTTG